jgi:hypothetical protein
MPFSPPQEYPLQPLVDDCRLLGSLLDDCLRIEVGEELFEKASRAACAWGVRQALLQVQVVA